MSLEKEKNWYFTFGLNHKYPNHYVKIFGTYETTRKEMFKRYGSKWCFQYDSPKMLCLDSSQEFKELKE